MKKLDAIHSPGQLTLLAALLAGLAVPAGAVAPSPPPANHIVISQVYGGGGNSGATLTNDYVELFNPTPLAISLKDMAVQYASSAGAFSTVGTNLPDVMLQPGHYFLVQESSNAAVGGPMPAPDASGGIQMAAGAGKVVLVTGTTALGAGAVPTSPRVIDWVAYGTGATPFEGAVGPTSPTLTSTTAAFRTDECSDINDNRAEFTAKLPAPRNTASAAKSCGGVVAYDIVPSCPGSLPLVWNHVGAASLSASDQDNKITGASISSGAAAGITLDGFSPSSANGASATATLNVTAAVPSGSYPVGITFTNDGGQTASCTVNVTVPAKHAIMEIQGSGATSPYANTLQATEGVITYKFAGNGFFIQDPNGDGDPSTSDGIYIFGGVTSAAVGDLVRVTGTVTEYAPAGQPFSYTEIKDVVGVDNLGAGPQIIPANVAMPTDLGKVQGMLVRFTNPLIINQVSSLGDRGEMTLASIRREVPSNRYPAGSPEAIQLAASNTIDQIVLDDGSFTVPPTVPYVAADKTVRAGDSVTDLVGVVDFGSIGNSENGYKLQPLSVPSVTISRTNPRTDGPVLPSGNVRVASANVLNFFTTFTNGFNYLTKTTTGCAIGTPVKFANGNCRGADSEAEFLRQRDKIVNELAALNADVVGLMEIQNGGDQTVAYLVDSLNAKLGSAQYAYVANVPSAGDDAIRVAMIYRPSAVTPVGAPMSDDNAINNRAPIAQTFKANNGARFSVIVNHLKSKGSCPSGSGADADHNDSQGCWNATRVQQAQRLVSTFIPAVKAAAGDDDVLLIGDFNSHGFEDPINVLTGSGVVNELERFVRPNGIVYSYVFDGLSGYLDHALASPSLDAQVAGATEWHNNADEPDVIDYNIDSKPQDLYVNNAYRASDHDPVVISLNLTPTFSNITGSFSIYRSALAINRSTGQFSGTITFTNTSGAAINGPFQVEFSGMPAGVTLANATGSHNGVQYITAGAASVAAGATVTLTTVFNNPSKGAIPNTATIYSGTF